MIETGRVFTEKELTEAKSEISVVVPVEKMIQYGNERMWLKSNGQNFSSIYSFIRFCNSIYLCKNKRSFKIPKFVARLKNGKNKKSKKNKKFSKQFLDDVSPRADVLAFPDKIARLKKWARSGKHKIDKKYRSKRAVKMKVNKSICEVCNSRPAYCMHHIFPLCQGGSNNTNNLIAICEECHLKVHPFMKDKRR